MKKAPQKILAGIGVATLLGSAALGFLIFQNKAAFTAAKGEFDKTASSYQSLRSQPLYPSQANLKKLEEQRDAAAEAANAALQEMQPLVIPLEAITPEQFQDRLRQAVSDVTAKAAERNVGLPDGFYLGFDTYRTQAPSPKAAPALWRQMRAIELVINIIIDSRVAQINTLTRPALVEEGGKDAAAALITRIPFAIDFRSSQASFRRVLNEVTSSKTQFFIPRNIVVRNDGSRQIPKAAPTPIAPMIGAEGGVEAASVEVVETPAQTTHQGALQYLVGTENLDVSLNLEMVLFADTFGKK